MTGKIDYLEKYSVAPSPSRDYYGLKVLRDEVILYLWKISHGPHKTPLVRTANFLDFEQDKSLLDDIQRVFDGRLLNHIRNIVRGKRNTLLTLPRCLVKRLLSYLSVQDIVKLSSLCYTANQIFNDNSIWETLYKRHKCDKAQNPRGMAHEWKELFKENYMQPTCKRKNPQTRPTTRPVGCKPKREETASTKPIRSTDSVPNVTPKKLVESIPRKPSPNLSRVRKSQGIPPEKPIIPRMGQSSRKKAPSVASIPTTGQRNARHLREQRTVKNVSVEESRLRNVSSSKSTDSRLNKELLEDGRCPGNTKNVSNNGFNQGKINGRSGMLNTPGGTSKERKGDGGMNSRSVQNKGKAGSKGKIAESKSTVLRTDKAFIDDSLLVKDSSFNLTDLIRASLKNLQSPRSVFDYDFSALEKFRSASGDGKLTSGSGEKIEGTKGLKVSRSNVLERLSEKSEPLTGKSTSPGKKSESDAAFPGCARMKFPGGEKKGGNFCGITGSKCEFERYGGYGKFSAPAMNESGGEKGSDEGKFLDRMDILRSLGNIKSGRNSRVVTSRGGAKKSLENSYGI